MIALAQDKTYKFDWIYSSNDSKTEENNKTASFYCQENYNYFYLTSADYQVQYKQILKNFITLSIKDTVYCTPSSTNHLPQSYY